MARENEDLHQLSAQINKTTSKSKSKSTKHRSSICTVAQDINAVAMTSSEVQTEHESVIKTVGSVIEDLETYDDDFDEDDDTEIQTEIHK